MSKRRILLFLFALSAFLAFPAGCGKSEAGQPSVTPSIAPTVTDTPTPTATPEPLKFAGRTVIFNEPNNRLRQELKMYRGSRDGISYWFDAAITVEDREIFVKNTEHILGRICPGRNTERKLDIFIFPEEKYNGTYIEDDCLYTFYTASEDADFITKLLLLVYGGFANLGITESYAEYIEVSLAGRDFIVPEFKWDEDNDLSILDLNLLCHKPEFVSATETEYVKNIAGAFVGSYIEKNGEEALRELIAMSGDTDKVGDFCHVLSDYYRQNGIEYTPSSVLYAYGGVTYDYFVKTEFATMYFEKNWEINWEGYKGLDYSVFDGFLRKDYAETKKYYETTREEMRKYQEFFAFDSFDNSLKIFYSNGTSENNYQLSMHKIRLDRIDVLSHEYIHSITMKNSDMFTAETYRKWAVEGFAQYYMYKYNYYGNLVMNKLVIEYEAKQDSDPLKKYVETIGRDLDVNLFEDWTAYCHIYSLYLDDYDLDKNPYIDGASLIAYMVEKYGEKEAIAMIYPENKLTGDNLTDLVEEWKEYVRTKYAEYKVIE